MRSRHRRERRRDVRVAPAPARARGRAFSRRPSACGPGAWRRRGRRVRPVLERLVERVVERAAEPPLLPVVADEVTASGARLARARCFIRSPSACGPYRDGHDELLACMSSSGTPTDTSRLCGTISALAASSLLMMTAARPRAARRRSGCSRRLADAGAREVAVNSATRRARRRCRSGSALSTARPGLRFASASSSGSATARTPSTLARGAQLVGEAQRAAGARDLEALVAARELLVVFVVGVARRVRGRAAAAEAAAAAAAAERSARVLVSSGVRGPRRRRSPRIVHHDAQAEVAPQPAHGEQAAYRLAPRATMRPLSSTARRSLGPGPSAARTLSSRPSSRYTAGDDVGELLLRRVEAEAHEPPSSRAPRRASSAGGAR